MAAAGITICLNHGPINRPVQDNQCPVCGDALVWYADQIEAALALGPSPALNPGLFDAPVPPVPLIGNPADRGRVALLLRAKLVEATHASQRGEERARANAKARIDLLLELYLPLLGMQPKQGGR